MDEAYENICMVETGFAQPLSRSLDGKSRVGGDRARHGLSTFVECQFNLRALLNMTA